MLAVLDAVGSDAQHVVKLTMYLSASVDPMDADSSTLSVWSGRRTAATVLAIDPAKPGALVEIVAIASIPRA